MPRSVFCHHGSDTVQDSPVSSGVNRKNPIFSSATPARFYRLAAIEIAALARMFSLRSLETAPAHKGNVAVSCEDDIGATSGLADEPREKFRIRTNELLAVQKIAHAQMVGCARSRHWTPRAAIFQNSLDRTIENAKSPEWPNACREGSAKRVVRRRECAPSVGASREGVR